MPAEAIGFFDSGVGGLSVLRHALDRCNGLPLLYVADSAYVPYGGRPAEQITARCIRVSQYLVDAGAAAIVVACNTATAVAIDALRERFDVPIIGMEPALKPAAAATHSGRIAVLATDGTLGSRRYARLLSDHAGDVVVHQRVCHDWVGLVERDELDTARARQSVARELLPLRQSGVDTYVLGCTHFPFLSTPIRAVVGDSATLIDPGAAVVAQLRRRLGLVESQARSSLQLFDTGAVSHLASRTRALLGVRAGCSSLTR